MTTFTIANALACKAALGALVHACICGRERMPVLATNFPTVPPRATPNIDQMCDRLQMIGVYAIAATALVIQLFACGNGANQHQISGTMRPHCLTGVESNSVTFFGEWATPKPTRFCFLNLAPECAVSPQIFPVGVVALPRAINLLGLKGLEFLFAGRANTIHKLPWPAGSHVFDHNIIDFLKV
jgi:hypothetical protein